ncbi:protein bicaudal D2-like [Arapaima gigas]
MLNNIKMEHKQKVSATTPSNNVLDGFDGSVIKLIDSSGHDKVSTLQKSDFFHPVLSLMNNLLTNLNALKIQSYKVDVNRPEMMEHKYKEAMSEIGDQKKELKMLNARY